MDELDFYDPDEEYDLELLEAPKRRRRKRKNPEPAIAVATPVLLLGLGYVAWCWYNQTRFKVWNWQPWQLAGRPSLQLRRPRLNLTEEAEKQRQAAQAAYDRSVEKMMAPAVSVVEQDLWRRPTHYDSEREIVSFIVP